MFENIRIKIFLSQSFNQYAKVFNSAFLFQKHKENSFEMACAYLQIYLVSHWTMVHIIIKLLAAAMYAINSKSF